MGLFDIDRNALAAAKVAADRAYADIGRKIMTDGRKMVLRARGRRRKAAIVKSLEAENRAAEDFKRLIDSACILRNAVTDDAVQSLRDYIRRIRPLAVRVDVSTAVAIDARRAIAAARKQMKAVCPHPAVVHAVCTARSDGRRRVVRCKGEAGCVVCDFTATDDDCEGVNSSLPDDDTRVVQWHVLSPYELPDGQPSHEKRSGLAERLFAYRAYPTLQLALDAFFGKDRLQMLEAVIAAVRASRRKRRAKAGMRRKK
jgi:hypothetical protein